MKAKIKRGPGEELLLEAPLSDRLPIFAALQQGREVEATIEIKRAPLPDGYAWVGSDIVCPLIDARWSVETWLTANKAGPSIAACGTRVVPAFVIDAFRAEGLI
jgi:hypothetical protein